MSTVHPDYRTEDGTRQLWLNPLTGATELVPNEYALDERDRDILTRRFHAWSDRALESGGRPRVGDYVRFADGTERRFSHDWDEYGLQTSDGGSFYFGDGYCSFSGSLFGCTLAESLTLAVDQWGYSERRDGPVWFFHHDSAGAGRGVNAFIPCRVFTTDEKAPA